MRNVHTRLYPCGRRSTHGQMFPFWKRDSKRRAKRAEWVGFLREQHALALADAYSAEVEDPEAREAEEAAICVAQDAAIRARMEQVHAAIRARMEQMHAEQALHSMRQQWLARMGAGTLFWENLGVDTWTLSRVDVMTCYDPRTMCEVYDFIEQTVFSVVIDRAAQHWVLLDAHYTRIVELPYEAASLDNLQAIANVLARIA